MSESASAKRLVAASISRNEMTILREDGLYRHIRFQQPGTAICWFDLITWPHHLVISGDFDSFHFSREEDMFNFFEHCGNDHGINPGYWAEKIQGTAKARCYSPELFRSTVVKHFWESRRNYRGDTVELWRSINRNVLEYSEDEHQARAALIGFRHVDIKAKASFGFRDAWEWDFTDFDYHYLKSLHAIVFGIAQYRGAKQLAA